jgi:hypothetical protein
LVAGPVDTGAVVPEVAALVEPGVAVTLLSFFAVVDVD